jgi:hypothetical protein
MNKKAKGNLGKRLRESSTGCDLLKSESADRTMTLPPAAAPALTKRAALDILSEAGGHAWLFVEAGERIAQAFGLTVSPQRQRANTGEFKGLMVAGVAPGTIVAGYSGVDLAETIAETFPDHPDIPRRYRWQEGRGSRGQSACEAIKAALDLAGE